jgi:hypothetical protein
MKNIKDINIQHLNIPFKKIFKIQGLLGVGAFGVVLEVLNKFTQENSALKVNNCQLSYCT